MHTGYPLTIDSYIAFAKNERPALDEAFARGYMQKLISGEYELIAHPSPRVVGADGQELFLSEEVFDFCRRVVACQRLIESKDVEQFISRLRLGDETIEAHCRKTLNQAIRHGYRVESGCYISPCVPSCDDACSGSACEGGRLFGFGKDEIGPVCAVLNRLRTAVQQHNERGVRIHEEVERSFCAGSVPSEEIVETDIVPETNLAPTDILRARAIVRAVTRKCDSAGVVDTATALDDKLVALTRALSRSGAAVDVCSGGARVMRVVFEKDSPIPVTALPEIKHAVAADVLSYIPFDEIPSARALGEVLIAFANWVESFGRGTRSGGVENIENFDHSIKSDLAIEE